MRKLSFLIVTQDTNSFVRMMQELKRLQCPCDKICWCSGLQELSTSTFVAGKKWRCQKWSSNLAKKADLILLLPGIDSVSELEKQAQVLKIPCLDLRGKAVNQPVLVEDCKTTELNKKWNHAYLADPETIFCVYSCYNLKKEGLIESIKIQLIMPQQQSESWIAQKTESIIQQLAFLFDMPIINLQIECLYQPQVACSSLQLQVMLNQSLSHSQLAKLIQQADHVLLLQQEKEVTIPEILSLKETRVLIHIPQQRKQGKLWNMQLISDYQLCGSYSAGVLLIMDLIRKSKV